MTWTRFSQQPRASELLYHSLLNNRLAHAYLFAGPKGAGKKQMALHLAKSLFCPEREADACGACVTCRRIEGGGTTPMCCLLHRMGLLSKSTRFVRCKKKWPCER
ncbi:hypothetical protein [Brevibacillus gelatini]